MPWVIFKLFERSAALALRLGIDVCFDANIRMMNNFMPGNLEEFMEWYVHHAPLAVA